jgi:two-component system CheB/CheR fusion protein
MTPPRSVTDARVHAAAAALAATIFTADVLQPSAGLGVLHALVVMLGLRSRWKPFPAVAAAGVIALVWAAASISPAGLTMDGVTRAVVATALCVGAAWRVDTVRRLQRQTREHLTQLTNLKQALDHAAIVATTDVSGRITDVNEKFCRISGYAREELLGQDHRIINSAGHPKEFMRTLWHTIARGEVWHGEIRNRAKDGHFYWVDTTIVPFLNARGKPERYIAIRADVTARKLAEEQLVQQASLARVGELAAVVAHEVRNPLAGIKGAMQVLMTRRPPGDSEITVMQDVVARIDSLSELINDLMVYARPSPPKLGTVELRALVAEAVTMVRRDPGVVIDVVPGKQIPLTGDANLLRAALLNLLLNAAQAAAPVGHVTVTARQTGDVAIVEIQDTGPGIPRDVRERIFEPFFTTKARGGGLGLPTARRTTELHGGTLSLECPAAGGTLAVLKLPVTGPSVSVPPAADPSSDADTTVTAADS